MSCTSGSVLWALTSLLNSPVCLGFVFCLNILDDSCNESGPQTKHALSTGRFEGQLQLQYHLLDNELVQKGLNQGWIYTCELCVCALQCCVWIFQGALLLCLSRVMNLHTFCCVLVLKKQLRLESLYLLPSTSCTCAFSRSIPVVSLAEHGNYPLHNHYWNISTAQNPVQGNYSNHNSHIVCTQKHMHTWK